MPRGYAKCSDRARRKWCSSGGIKVCVCVCARVCVCVGVCIIRILASIQYYTCKYSYNTHAHTKLGKSQLSLTPLFCLSACLSLSGEEAEDTPASRLNRA
jgi:hypothetical protein